MLSWSMPIRGWSPKQGQPLPPGSVVSIRYWRHGPVGSAVVLTAMSTRPSVDVALRNRMVANHLRVEGSK
jgi:hypothetical protein